MRIVGGRFKGRNLVGFKGDAVRPTSDQARESLFNILQFKIQGKTFLDLFCGTGAVGIEALSRGAKKVVLNDQSRESLSIAKKNLSAIGIEKEVDCLNQNALSLLASSPSAFDIIFMDPPYNSGIEEQAITLAKNVLEEDGLIILESEKDFDFKIEGLAVIDKRKYGRARFTFFKRSL